MNNEVLQGVGPRLAAAREAKGMATAEVAAKLRLGVRQIEALEADAYEQLPGEVFVRGFIRNYAKLLDLDPDALLPTQDVVVSDQLTVPSTNLRFQPSPIQRWLLLPVGSAILFFALVALLYAWLSSGEQAAVEQPEEMVVAPQDSQIVAPEPVVLDQAQTDAVAATAESAVEPAGAQPSAAPAQAGAAPAVASVPPANKPSVIDASKPVLPPLPGVAVKPAAEAAKPPLPATAKPAVTAAPIVAATAPLAVPASKPTVPAASAPAGRSLVFQPVEDSWVQVVDAKGQRFSKLLRAGSTETVEGTPPFRLVVGNAATMKLSHNGKLVDLKPFIGEKVARLKLGEEGASKLNPPPVSSKPADGQSQ